MTALGPTRTAPEPAAPVAFAHPRDVRAALQAATPDVSFLVVPASRYFIVEGTSAPGDEEFRSAIGTLYPVAYTLHFLLRRRGVAARIGSLEGEYSAMVSDAEGGWHWRLALPIPDPATSADIAAAIDEVRRKGSAPRIDALHVETVPECEMAQVLHVGPYDAEAPTVGRLLDAIAAAGRAPCGGHREIYVSDPNRMPPGRLKTVLRMQLAVP